jgi:hypothetical protein
MRVKLLFSGQKFFATEGTENTDIQGQDQTLLAAGRWGSNESLWSQCPLWLSKVVPPLLPYMTARVHFLPGDDKKTPGH